MPKINIYKYLIGEKFLNKYRFINFILLLFSILFSSLSCDGCNLENFKLLDNS